MHTFNGLGHRIWQKANAKNLTLNPKKSQDLFKLHVDTLTKAERREAWTCYWEVINAVAQAKSLGYVPSGKFPNANRLISAEEFRRGLEERPSELTCELVDRLLTESIKAAYDGYIDYNDQIYMPALFGGTFPRFPHVLVDEAQDLSPVNHAMLNKLVKGRISIVGDPWQSIYGFRGAVQAGMDQLRRQFQMQSLDLTVSFRCPRRIVENVHWHVPKMKWNREGGRVEHLSSLRSESIPDSAAIICRNNAPLFRCAFNLLSSGRSVSVAGSDIGPKVINTMRKLGDGTSSRQQVLGYIASWRQDRLDKGSSSADDLAACMAIFAEHGTTLDQAIAYAEHLFAQRGSIRLLTGHKAKGLEWDTVYHLDPWLIGDDDQERNLRYVISTRAKQELFEIDSRNIKW